MSSYQYYPCWYAEINSLAAICVRRNGIDSMYYIHPDRLGSYTHITNSGKQVIRALHFDPWGNVKSDADWTAFDTTTLSGNLAGTSRFDRGFTGHEHYADLKIINMKAPSKREQKQACLIFVKREVLRDEVSTYGRLYDPVIARFFSPDNFVQAPGFTQSYNRYSYCLNNPLQYTDPSGEIAWFVPVIIGAVIGAYTGGVIANNNYNPIKWDYSSGKTWGYMAGGAVVGGVSGYFGWAVTSCGMPLANTAGIISSSFTNSVGTFIYTGGQAPVSVCFGAFSYDITNNEWGWLWKSGNGWSENLGYAMGVLANLQDIVTLNYGEGENIMANSASTKEDWWGHSSLTSEKGETYVSVGPSEAVQDSSPLAETWKNSIKDADLNWKNYFGEKGTWSIQLNNGSKNAIDNYMSGVNRWDLLLNSCVGHTTRALWTAGIPTLYLFHPHMLNVQLLVRQLGIYASPYIYNNPK